MDQPPKSIPRTDDHRPDASAQSRLLAWLALGTALLIGLPCLTFVIMEASGATHLLAIFIPPDGMLAIEVDDPAAGVLIAGQNFARSLSPSMDNPLPPGDYSVTITYTVNGQYNTYRETVTVESGKRTVITVPSTGQSADEDADSATNSSSESTPPPGSP